MVEPTFILFFTRSMIVFSLNSIFFIIVMSLIEKVLGLELVYDS